MSTAAHPIREVRLGAAEVVIDRRPDGTIYVRSKDPLGPYAEKMTERLDHWAAVAPDRTFLAERAPDKSWRRLTYAEARDQARSVGQALINRGLSPNRPVAVLSANDLEHALIQFGALYAGVPYAPISPAYSLVSTDLAKLRHILGLLTPGMVFASSGTRFQKAIQAVVPAGTEVVVTTDAPPGTTLFHDLVRTPAGASLDAAHAKVSGDTIAKVLFTSGSTGWPKGVINTHRMWSSNQAMACAYFAFLADEPPVIVDWLPWNHTFAGNADMGMILYNGGTLYIDHGKPAPGFFEETARNLREVAPTMHLNVPRGFEMLVPYLRREPRLRRNFFSRLKVMYYAGAGLSQHVWDELEQLAIETCGERILMLTGLGSTETAPHALFAREAGRAGMVGLPAPGVELKLVPAEGKLDARLRGPNITPGYWRQEALTNAAFDEEGFYKLGDALRFVDETEPSRGFMFDGRLAEDFKLATGTWVSVGPLRARLLGHFAPYIQDVVIAGHDRDSVGVLIFPEIPACRLLCPGLGAEASAAEVLANPSVRSTFERLLNDLAQSATGSSNRVAAAILLDEPPSIDAHEVTDKGSLNQRAVLEKRAALVEELYQPSSRAIRLKT